MRIKFNRKNTLVNNSVNNNLDGMWKADNVRTQVEAKVARQMRRKPVEREVRGQLIHNTLTQAKVRTRESRYLEDR